MKSQKKVKYPGLRIQGHHIKDAESKEHASQSLYGWEQVELTAEEWIQELEKGHTIQPSTFVADPTGKITHAKDYWKETYFILADGDNFKGEKDTDGQTAVEPWTEKRGLSQRFPKIKDFAYAVGQSVSSMTDAKNYRRYRLIFLFDAPITTEAHYHQILLRLAQEFPIIPPITRSPAQPVFGNAREGFNSVATPKNILKLSDFPYEAPQGELSEEVNAVEPKPRQKKKKKARMSLDDFIREHSLSTLKARPKGGYFVRCPFGNEHASGKNGDTDAYIWENPDGSFAFHCSHATCKNAGRSNWEAYREAVAPKPPEQKAKEAAFEALEAEAERVNVYFDQKRFLPTPMMDHLDEDYHFMAFPNEKQIRVYQDGVYRLDTAATIDRAIHTELGAMAKHASVSETLSMLQVRHKRDLPRDGSFPCHHPHHINLLNGVYSLKDRVLSPHTPGFKSIVQVPVKYHEVSKCPEIDAFLEDVLQGKAEDIALAHEMMGISLLQQTPIPKLCVLVGPTHTGKSTFLDVVRALLGSENVSSVSLQALDNDELRFARSALYGKLANLSADLSKKTLAGDNIKMITAGDAFDVERKGVDSFRMRPFATLFCACNEVPRSRDKSDAYLDRLIILPFTKQHIGKNAKRGLLRSLTTEAELSGLLNHAIQAMHRVLETGIFSETATVREAKARYEKNNNAVLQFLADGYHQDPDGRIKEKYLWKSFTDWCDEEGLNTPTKSHFRDSLKNWGCVRKRGKDAEGGRDFIFDGISPGVREEVSPSVLDDIPF